MEKQRIDDVRKKLLSWYDVSARVLPWRTDPTPYKVWISEIMLQQTRVDTVIPYFERFVKEIPSIAALAACEEERLLKLWEGLGYYSRVRNLKKAALEIESRFSGELPKNKKDLESLPGIGEYASGSVSSIAFGVSTPAVDGNVIRVIARLEALEVDSAPEKAKREIIPIAISLVPESRPGDFNQALMDLGATVCLPNGSPDCGHCPLSSLCLALKENKIDLIPPTRDKTSRRIEPMTVFVIHGKDHFALRKRGSKGLLANLYEFPNTTGHLNKEEAIRYLEQNCLSIKNMVPIGSARHIFSHLEWDMQGYSVEVYSQSDSFEWVTKSEIDSTYPIPTAFDFIKKMI